VIKGKTFLSLRDLYTGETAEITYIDDNTTLGKRLRDMGLREGVLVELISYDNVINKKVVLKIDNSTLAFDSTAAESIKVRPIKAWYNFYREQAFCDALTGTLNKNAALLILSEEYEKAQKNKIPFSLILIDIDDFKKINDTYGHAFGDKVLQELGNFLRRNIRRTDLVFRWGGEEFLILMKGLAIEDAYLVANRLRETIPYCINIPPYGSGIVKISAGVDGAPPYVYLNDLFERVDKALYAAKFRGKNQVCTFFWRKCEAY